MNERLIFSGFGGQGLITAGKLLVSCAVNEGKHVTYFPSYGSAVRGGTANCQMVISDEPILSPMVEEATALLMMNRESMARFLPMLAPGGLAVVNTSMVDLPRQTGGAQILGIAATEIATKLGSVQVANVVMLAALNEVKHLVGFDSLHDGIIKALRGRRAALIPANENALETGRVEARAWLAK
jgi:2-oxoglutarate ferredoxin oxidoreductase subunit gamma